MSDSIEALVIGFVLCADSFSAALALGTRKHNLRDALRLAFTSGGVEALVALLGAYAGKQFLSQFDFIDHWVSFVLLLSVSLHMFWETYQEVSGDTTDTEKIDREFHGYFKILVVSFATSLDALAVGVSLGVGQKPLPIFIVSIGLWAFIASLLGMKLSAKATQKWGPFVNLFGATILMLMAIWFLVEGL